MTDLFLTFVLPDRMTDLWVSLDLSGDGKTLTDAVASGLRVPAGGFGLTLERTGASVTADGPVADLGLRWGDRLIVTSDATVAVPAAPFALCGLSGPLVGCWRPLWPGANKVGRLDWVRATDGAMSREHAEVTVNTEGVFVRDLGSRNGVEVNGERVEGRIALTPQDRIRLGDSELAVVAVDSTDRRSHLSYGEGRLAFGRSVDVTGTAPTRAIQIPDPPPEPITRRFSISMIVVPALMGVVLFVVTGSALYLVLTGMTPLMAIWNLVDDRRSGKRKFEEEAEAYGNQLMELASEADQASRAARTWRHTSQPSIERLLDRAVSHSPEVWPRQNPTTRLPLLSDRHRVAAVARDAASADDRSAGVARIGTGARGPPSHRPRRPRRAPAPRARLDRDVRRARPGARRGQSRRRRPDHAAQPEVPRARRLRAEHGHRLGMDQVAAPRQRPLARRAQRGLRRRRG